MSLILTMTNEKKKFDEVLRFIFFDDDYNLFEFFKKNTRFKR